MSDDQAIAGVSATLQNLLEDRMELPVGVSSLQVTVSTPRSEQDNGQGVEEPRVNLFLYHVTENAALKNQEMPGFGHPGAYGHPPLSLDLHYLLTAYGSTLEAGGEFVNETLAHHLLGGAMRVLHEHPVITEALTKIQGSIDEPILDPSLHDAFEQVKLFLEPMDVQRLADLWSGLSLPYRLSAAYMVSVVQIESQQPRSYPKPVGTPPEGGPQLTVVTSNAPKIEQLRIQPGGDVDKETTVPYARIGDTLVIQGSNFIQDATSVQIGSVLYNEPVIKAERLEVIIEDEETLQPGAQPVHVVRDILVGDPPEARPGFRSNQAVFMLVPHAVNPTLTAGVVTITGTRLYEENKDCQTILGNEVIHSAAYTSATSTGISFPLPVLAPGTYTVRVRVNGAESIDAQIIEIQ